MWARFASTKVGRWLIGLGAVVAAIVAALGIGWLKGRKSQAAADVAKVAAQYAKDAKAAQETYAAAADAAAQVRQEASKRPAPDPDNRDAFNSDF